MELIQETLKGKDNLDMFISKRNRKNPDSMKIEDFKGTDSNFKNHILNFNSYSYILDT